MGRGAALVQPGTDLDLPGVVEDHQAQQDDRGEADEAFKGKRVQGPLGRERAEGSMVGAAALPIPYLHSGAALRKGAPVLAPWAWTGTTPQLLSPALTWAQHFPVHRAGPHPGSPPHSLQPDMALISLCPHKPLGSRGDPQAGCNPALPTLKWWGNSFAPY